MVTGEARGDAVRALVRALPGSFRTRDGATDGSIRRGRAGAHRPTLSDRRDNGSYAGTPLQRFKSATLANLRVRVAFHRCRIGAPQRTTRWATSGHANDHFSALLRSLIGRCIAGLALSTRVSLIGGCVLLRSLRSAAVLTARRGLAGGGRGWVCARLVTTRLAVGRRSERPLDGRHLLPAARRPVPWWMAGLAAPAGPTVSSRRARRPCGCRSAR